MVRLMSSMSMCPELHFICCEVSVLIIRNAVWNAMWCIKCPLSPLIEVLVTVSLLQSVKQTYV